jgi:superfamily II DNA/RNA helicase
LLIGGEPMSKQFHQLKNRPRLIVGTPGRINDHLKRGTLRLNDTCFLVLDETDRMLDMGFGVQLDAINAHLTAPRQTLMFSATMPKNIQKLSAKYLKDPIRIQMGSTEAPAANVTQEHVRVSEGDKYARLLTELDQRSGSVIIFVKTKHGADRLADKLCRDGHEADALHGDLRQSKRDRVIADFRKQDYRVLVATDVAARGLDIPHIEHVINHDLPQSPEDYIHRIGRTARAGAKGSALSFLSPQDGPKWRAIQRLIDPDFKDEERGPRQPRRPSFDGGFRGDKGGFAPDKSRRPRPHRGQGNGRPSRIAA